MRWSCRPCIRFHINPLGWWVSPDRLFLYWVVIVSVWYTFFKIVGIILPIVRRCVIFQMFGSWRPVCFWWDSLFLLQISVTCTCFGIVLTLSTQQLEDWGLCPWYFYGNGEFSFDGIPIWELSRTLVKFSVQLYIVSFCLISFAVRG